MTKDAKKNSEEKVLEQAPPLPLQGEKSNVNRFIWPVVALVLAVIFLQMWLIHHKERKLSSVQEVDETYSASSPITREQKEKSMINNSLDKQRELEQKIAQAKAQDFMERLQTPQAASLEGGGNNTIQGASATFPERTNGSSNLTQVPEDPNTAFLRQAGEAQTERQYATLFKPLRYLIGQGKFIFGTLAVAIHSDLPGQIEAVVNQDVYGEQGEKILIPRGSHLIGEYRSGLSNNQSRLFTVWTRIKEPNGVDIRLGSEGTDSLGRAGVTGQVDYHFFDRFGSAILISMISAGAATSGVSTKDQYNSASVYREGVSQALAEQAKNTLSEDVHIPPTIHVPQGARIVVFVNKDLDFSQVYR
ncbi:MAG: avhB10 [Gammaproteobacteria bacterium]|jgi:type IV secretion system protein VirB10|nr:avhB10 [Gammaproteobacteria bacterium]